LRFSLFVSLDVPFPEEVEGSELAVGVAALLLVALMSESFLALNLFCISSADFDSSRSELSESESEEDGGGESKFAVI